MALTSNDPEGYQTDVESLDGASTNNSSVTQCPLSSEETDYEEDLRELVESQFPPEAVGEKTGQDVQEWLNNANDGGTEDVSKTPGPSFMDVDNIISSETIEKVCIMILINFHFQSHSHINLH